jgi:Ca2+:H+ antiporter
MSLISLPQSVSYLSVFRWFGLILLPLVSVTGDGFLAIFYFGQTLFLDQPTPPVVLAKARAIDLSIQFSLFWMPFIVQLGWWIGKPMHLLFGAPSF